MRLPTSEMSSNVRFQDQQLLCSLGLWSAWLKETVYTVSPVTPPGYVVYLQTTLYLYIAT